MSSLQNISIKGKIYSSSAITLILMAAVGYTGFYGLTKMNGAEIEMNQKWLPALQMTGKLDLKLADLRRYEIRFTYAAEEKGR